MDNDDKRMRGWTKMTRGCEGGRIGYVRETEVVGSNTDWGNIANRVLRPTEHKICK